MNKTKIVEFEWIDSCSTYGWNEFKGLEPSKIHSCGRVLKEDKKHITISTSLSDSGCSHSALTVPKFAIVGSIRVIKTIK